MSRICKVIPLLLFLCVFYAAFMSVKFPVYANISRTGGAATSSELGTELETEADEENDSAEETPALKESSSAEESDTGEAASPSTAQKTRDAETAEEEKELAAKKPIITAVYHTTYDLENLPVVEMTQNSSQNFNELYAFIAMLQSVTADLLYPDGSTETCTLKVAWNCVSGKATVDPSIVGAQTETGIITLRKSQDYEFAEGVLQTLTLPVSVLPPGEPTIITQVDSRYDGFHFACAVPVGGSSSDFYALEEHWGGYDAENNQYTCSIRWDYSAVDFEIPGVYPMTGTLEAPENCIFAEDLDVPTLITSVSVQEPGKPEINCFYSLDMAVFCFPWVTPPGELSEIKVWLSENDGEWMELQEMDEASVSSRGLFFYSVACQVDSSYRLRADYEGGSTGIFSFDYTGELTNISYVKGDRDGGDTDGNQSQTPDSEEGSGIIIDSGKPSGSGSSDSSDCSGNSGGSGSSDSSGNSGGSGSSDSSGGSEGFSNSGRDRGSSSKQTQTETFLNEVMRTAQNLSETQVSGANILMMLSANGKALFSADEISVSLPAESLHFLNIQPADLFDVRITAVSEHSFSVQILQNGAELTTLENIRITLPYQRTLDGASLLLLNKEQEKVSEGSYNDAMGLVSFLTDRTGLFFIAEEASKPDVNTETAENTETKEWEEQKSQTETVSPASAAASTAQADAPQTETSVQTEETQTKPPVSVFAGVLAAILLLWLG